MFEGNAEVVGVAGSTLTEECGDRPLDNGFGFIAEDCTELEVDDVEEALEWVWT